MVPDFKFIGLWSQNFLNFSQFVNLQGEILNFLSEMFKFVRFVRFYNFFFILLQNITFEISFLKIHNFTKDIILEQKVLKWQFDKFDILLQKFHKKSKFLSKISIFNF